MSTLLSQASGGLDGFATDGHSMTFVRIKTDMVLMSHRTIPGTLEVSAVCTVGGGAAGVGAACAAACCVGGLAGCTDLGATPGVAMGVNPTGPAAGATTWGIFGPAGAYGPGPGGTGYALLDGP